MTAEQTIVHVYIGRYGAGDLRSAGTIAVPCGVARAGDTITVRDGQYRIAHVHWLAHGEDQDGNRAASVDLYLEPTNAEADVHSRNHRSNGWR
jgi:hypothetical protein